MAALTFYKDPETTDQGFYLKMKSEVMQVLREMAPALGMYRGTFEFMVDRYNPGVQYYRDPKETIDEKLLQLHIITLRSRQFEIAVSLMT
jgi:2-iminoacetate synthase ThiH